MPSSTTTCRRSHTRFRMPDDARATVEFVHPHPAGHHCCMKLRDISASGVSFFLSGDLPGLEVGDSIDRVRINIEGYELHGDLLVMRLTPDASRGAVCGALFYPRGDKNLHALNVLLEELDRDGSLRAD